MKFKRNKKFKDFSDRTFSPLSAL
jgi:hypothetical protein